MKVQLIMTTVARASRANLNQTKAKTGTPPLQSGSPWAAVRGRHLTGERSLSPDLGRSSAGLIRLWLVNFRALPDCGRDVQPTAHIRTFSARAVLFATKELGVPRLWVVGNTPHPAKSR